MLSHIAIIMDGNGRWAAERGYPRIQGHRAGSRRVRSIATHAANCGLKYLTLYAFSSENWTRPEREIRLLMLLLKIYAVRERSILMKNNIRLAVIGQLELIPEEVRRELLATIEMTRHNTGMVLQLALSYGSRQELTDATRFFMEEAAAGRMKPEDLKPETFEQALLTAGQPDPDLVIRTSGEKRISNFLLWQSAYAEYYFSPLHWPDFDESAFDAAVEDFQKRERRFGGVTAQGVRA
jgi:undecaprenyl diphosphate synthase